MKKYVLLFPWFSEFYWSSEALLQSCLLRYSYASSINSSTSLLSDVALCICHLQLFFYSAQCGMALKPVQSNGGFLFWSFMLADLGRCFEWTDKCRPTVAIHCSSLLRPYLSDFIRPFPASCQMPKLFSTHTSIIHQGYFCLKKSSCFQILGITGLLHLL